MNLSQACSNPRAFAHAASLHKILYSHFAQLCLAHPSRFSSHAPSYPELSFPSILGHSTLFSSQGVSQCTIISRVGLHTCLFPQHPSQDPRKKFFLFWLPPQSPAYTDVLGTYLPNKQGPYPVWKGRARASPNLSLPAAAREDTNRGGVSSKNTKAGVGQLSSL